MEKTDTKPSDFYFSTPFLEKCEEEEGYFKVVIVPKVAYDKKGIWQDGGKEYRALFDVLPEQLSESMECVFEPNEKMSKEDIEKLLREAGFIFNSKLDDDVKEYFDISA
jgi:hypothetical protein